MARDGWSPPVSTALTRPDYFSVWEVLAKPKSRVEVRDRVCTLRIYHDAKLKRTAVESAVELYSAPFVLQSREFHLFFRWRRASFLRECWMINLAIRTDVQQQIRSPVLSPPEC